MKRMTNKNGKKEEVSFHFSENQTKDEKTVHAYVSENIGSKRHIVTTRHNHLHTTLVYAVEFHGSATEVKGSKGIRFALKKPLPSDPDVAFIFKSRNRTTIQFWFFSNVNCYKNKQTSVRKRIMGEVAMGMNQK